MSDIQHPEAFIVWDLLCSISTNQMCAYSAETRGYSAQKPHTNEEGMSAMSFSHADRPIGEDGDTIFLYYGAADSCMALATGSIRALLAWLDSHCSSTGAR